MIIHWLRKLIQFMVWLAIPPTKEDLARIDPDRKCPICGARKGKLRCVVMGPGGDTAGQVVLCEHCCAVCGARCSEKPVVAVSPEHVQPSKG